MKRPSCPWHDAPKSQRKTFGTTKFLVPYPGAPGVIVRCTCDDATWRWYQANRPEES